MSYNRKRIAITLNTSDLELLKRSRYLSEATGYSISALAKIGLQAIAADPTLIATHGSVEAT